MVIQLPYITDPRGNLSFIEGGGILTFEIQRCYWVYDVPGGRVRNGRALRTTSEFIVALSGSLDVVTDDGIGTEQIVHLNRSYQGVLIPPLHWRKIINFSTNSVAMILASAIYDENDYIRDYNNFKSLANGLNRQS